MGAEELQEELRDGWQTVSGRKKNSVPREDQFFSENELATTFFFTNFPEEWKEHELWRNFEKYRLLVDLYLAKKNTIRGNRFGFIRYLKVGDTKSFLSRFIGVKFGDCKIRINVEEYKKKRLDIPVASKIFTTINDLTVKTVGKFSTKDVAYADAIRGKKRGLKMSMRKMRKESSKKQEEKEELRKEMTLLTHRDCKEWLKCNLVGIVASFSALNNIGGIMQADGCEHLTVRYLGGLSVMVEFESEEEASSFLHGSMDTWKNGFNELKVWSVEDTPSTRIVSILISGLPPHAWCTYAFNTIAKDFSEVIIPEECSVENKNFSYGRVGILTKPDPRIKESIAVKIDDIRYQVSIIEYVFESSRLVPFLPPSHFDYISESEALFKSKFNGDDEVSEYSNEVDSIDSSLPAYPEKIFQSVSDEEDEGVKLKGQEHIPNEMSANNDGTVIKETFEKSNEDTHIQDNPLPAVHLTSCLVPVSSAHSSGVNIYKKSNLQDRPNSEPLDLNKTISLMPSSVHASKGSKDKVSTSSVNNARTNDEPMDHPHSSSTMEKLSSSHEAEATLQLRKEVGF